METSSKPVSRTLLLAAALTSTFYLEAGCATKNYVKQSVVPLNTQVDEVYELVRANEQRIKDIDHNAQTGIQSVQKREKEVEKKAVAAAADADKARKLAQTVQNRTEQVERDLTKRMSELDSYKAVDESHVLFRFDQSVLSPKAKAALDELAHKLKGTNGYLLELQGFTDRIGSEGYNLALSEKRVESVRRYLAQQHQIPLSHMFFLGFGEAQPSGKTRSDRAANRKVEIRLLKREGAAMVAQN